VGNIKRFTPCTRVCRYLYVFMCVHTLRIVSLDKSDFTPHEYVIIINSIITS